MHKNIENITETGEFTTEHTAMEVLKREQERSKAKDVGIIVLGMVTTASIAAIVAITIYLSNMNYKNDKEWRNLFNSYDFITQDGEGVNNVNSGWQGDLNNNPDAE